ncbi:hypothetical protein A3758_04245 [Oleiphilus sp. HI0118]|nr:hypothetical protein A3758_04245 [Oleiphilus sp. HI0118]KZZ80886.1 hypothetical protein A3767_09140 [Oleiphilus sp. HI0133]
MSNLKEAAAAPVDFIGIAAHMLNLPQNEGFLWGALELAKSGICVAPAAIKGHVFASGGVASGKEIAPNKSPSHGTVNIKTIKNWWEGSHKGAPICIVSGPTSNGGTPLAVIDLDWSKPPKGDDGSFVPEFIGQQSMDKLKQELGPLPADVPMVETPSGGIHMYFSYAEGIGNSAGKRDGLAEGVDTRGGKFDKDSNMWRAAGHVIFNPYVGYKPIQNGRLQRMPVAWQTALMNAKNKKGSINNRGNSNVDASDIDIAMYLDEGGMLIEGERDSTLYDLTLRTLGRTNSFETARQTLFEVGATKCDPPLPDAQLEKIWLSASRSDVALDVRQRGDVLSLLQTNGKTFKSNKYNLDIIMRSDAFKTEFDLKYDNFRQRVLVNGMPLADTHYSEIEIAISGRWFIDFGNIHVKALTEVIAKLNPVHSFRDWLHGLPKWDGKERFADLTTAFGIETPPPHLIGEWGDSSLDTKVLFNTFLAAVCRAHDVWEQVRHMTNLGGRQALGKSKAFKACCPIDPVTGRPWFNDAPSFSGLGQENGIRNLLMAMTGAVFVEFAELDGFKHQQVSAMKQLISMQAASVVHKYALNNSDVPCIPVFLGTFNPEKKGLYADLTGNSRFWTLICSSPPDIAYIEENRDQLWAEVLNHFRVTSRQHWFEDRADLDLLESRNKEFAAIFGGAADFSDLLANNSDLTRNNRPFMTADAAKKWCREHMTELGLDKVPNRQDIDRAFLRNGWTESVNSHMKSWAFKVTESDIEKWPSRLSRSTEGKQHAIGRGWVSPDAIKRMGDAGIDMDNISAKCRWLLTDIVEWEAAEMREEQ